MVPVVGLVTVLYKSDSVLEGFFRSLSEQNFKNYHLYLIDNDPSEATTQLINDLNNKYPIAAYTHVKNMANVGVATGNNQGIKLSLEDGADYVLLLNNDIEFYQPDLIVDMVARANHGEHLLVPKILYFDSKLIWMAGGTLLKNKGYTTHVGEEMPDDGKFNVDTYHTYAPTCFMLISKAVFEKIGLMDEKYFVYYDDTDFVLRAINAGFKVLLMSKCLVYHKVSSSTGGNETPFSIYYTNRNRVYFIRKNYNGLGKLITLGYTFLTRMGKFIKYDALKRDRMLSGIKDGWKL